MHHAATFILWVTPPLFDQKTTTAIFSLIKKQPLLFLA
ncbi:hypothetical protein LTSEINV_1887 [Salmonella enterica subsp. enterica serovar Inverness str. R8-3668]|uniref:Uncharacterized protein n=1 Tax=Salmonella enterica subsp. enterica serovar Inverness str. R8-3668 TaxID=913075 RepID=G5NBJ4_SALET|nr:hypothetical protein LTSEINV_1887 [Salmonella enterica subsp. enterica serovar Inverness str. R8-3668]